MSRYIVGKEFTTLSLFKKELRKGIKDKYSMSVSAFSKSEKAKKLGLSKNLSVYLTPNGGTSIKVLNILAKDLKIPGIKKKTIVTRNCIYKRTKSHERKCNVV